MIHKPILLNNLSIELPHKICFTDFSATVPYGSRIAIIGKNGSGKTSLLQMIRLLLSDLILIPDLLATN